MRDACSEMKRKIEDSIGSDFDATERDEVERHCAQCEACRAYREHLLEDDSRLAGFAEPRREAISRVRERVIERVRAAGTNEARGAATTLTLPRRLRSSRVLAKIPRIAALAAAAAAVIIAFVVIDLIRGAHNGPVPAFAAVQEKMQKCESVAYRIHLWRNGQWTTREEGRMFPRVYRKDYGDSIITDSLGIKPWLTELSLYPAENRAVISRLEFPSPECDLRSYKPPDMVNLLASWYKAKGFRFVRTERSKGRNVAVYEKFSTPQSRETHRLTAWVDLKTELPVRFEIISPRSGPNSDTYPFHLRLSDFLGDGSKPAGWVDVKPGEPCAIYDDFRWNIARDTSYFSLTPPAGYVVETRQVTWDSCMAEGEREAGLVALRLSKWLALFGGVFPDDLADLTDSTKIKRLLIAKYRRGGDPAAEFRAACEAAGQLTNFSAYEIIRYVVMNNPQSRERVAVNYVGKGATRADSQRIICWLKDENEPLCPGRSGNGPYFLIYADLHIVASPAPPKSAGK
jgi:hypothetical protein